MINFIPCCWTLKQLKTFKMHIKCTLMKMKIRITNWKFAQIHVMWKCIKPCENAHHRNINSLCETVCLNQKNWNWIRRNKAVHWERKNSAKPWKQKMIYLPSNNLQLKTCIHYAEIMYMECNMKAKLWQRQHKQCLCGANRPQLVNQKKAMETQHEPLFYKTIFIF